MRRVYISPDSIDAYVVQTYLEANGIESVVINEHLPVVTLSLAPDGVPTVSVVNDEDEELALHHRRAEEGIFRLPCLAVRRLS